MFSPTIDNTEFRIYKTYEQAAKVADAMNAEDEDWTYKVKETGNGFIVQIFDETGEFVSNLF